MKLVCVAYFHGSGGAEKQITMLANSMSEKGHEVHMVILAESSIKFNILESVVIHDLTYCESKNGNKLINRFRAFRKELKSIRPDITINFWFQSAYFCSFLRNSITGKTIYSERGDPGDNEYSGFLGTLRTLSFKKIDGFVFQSDGARDFFDKKIQNRSDVIPNPIKIPSGKFDKPCINRKKKIVTVGRLHPQKNQKLLIKAFNSIKEKIPNYNLEIYGEGELEGELKNQINRLNLEDRVFLMGTRTNILDYIYDASLFVLSSDYEGLPNTLMEAIALGVPCISTDCKPGGAEYLSKNVRSVFITPIDDVNALANKICDVLKLDPDELVRENEINKFRFSHSPVAIFSKWESFLYSVLYKD